MPAKPKHKPKAPRQPGLCRHGDRAYTRIRGRWIPLGTWGTPEAEAAYDKTIAEYLANGRRQKEPEHSTAEPTPVTVAELIAAYWTYAESRYGHRRSGFKTMDRIKHACSPLRARFGALPAKSFGPVALETIREDYIAAGLCRTTINERVRIAKDIFTCAVRRELIPPGVRQGLMTVKGLRFGESTAPEPRKVRPVSDEYVEAVLPHVLPPVRAMIELQRLTGMRPGEVTIMRGCDLDMSGDLWCYRPAYHKTERHGVQREIYIGTRGQEIIRPFLRPELEQFLFQPVDALAVHQAAKRENRKSKVQPSQLDRSVRNPKRKPGDHYGSGGYGRAVIRGCDKAWPAPPEILKQGTEAVKIWLKEKPEEVRRWRKEHHWRPHQLRHSAATRLRKLYGLEAARITLGHTCVATTELYCERDREVALRIAREVG